MKTLDDFLGKSTPLTEEVVKMIKEDSPLLDFNLDHLPKPVNYKEDCYYYCEVQDMQARIPTCNYHGVLGYCPCEGCNKYVSGLLISKIAKTISDGVE